MKVVDSQASGTGQWMFDTGVCASIHVHARLVFIHGLLWTCFTGQL